MSLFKPRLWYHNVTRHHSNMLVNTCCQIRCSSINESRYRLHTRITQQSLDRYNGFHGENRFTHIMNLSIYFKKSEKNGTMGLMTYTPYTVNIKNKTGGFLRNLYKWLYAGYLRKKKVFSNHRKPFHCTQPLANHFQNHYY